MPQLAKGGKNVFAWSKINNEGRLIIPEDAFKEYGFKEEETAILMSGSKKSRGFGLSRLVKFMNSPISSSVVEAHPELVSQEIPEGETICYKSRYFCWVRIRNRSITLSATSLRNYGIGNKGLLLAVRGSDFGIGFIVRGPIIEKARKHDELMIYQ